MSNGGCTVGVENKERIRALENVLTQEVKPNIESLFNAVSVIKDDLVKRPSWATLTIISLLSSACVGLLIFAIR